MTVVWANSGMTGRMVPGSHTLVRDDGGMGKFRDDVPIPVIPAKAGIHFLVNHQVNDIQEQGYGIYRSGIT